MNEIKIQSSNFSLHAYAFSGCGEEISLIYDNGVTNIIGIQCSNCTNISLPSTATTISDFAFSGYTKLTSINIPSSVNIIGSQAFRNCTNLTQINVDKIQNSISKSPWGATNAIVKWKE